MIKPGKPAISRPYSIGVTIGALVLTFFGTFWALEALSSWPMTPPYFYTILSQPVLWITIFAGFRLKAVMKLPPSINEDQLQPESKKAGIIFGIIFSAEFILIAAAVLILRLLTAHCSFRLP